MPCIGYKIPATEKPGRIYLHLFNWPDKVSFSTGQKAAPCSRTDARQSTPISRTVFSNRRLKLTMCLPASESGETS